MSVHRATPQRELQELVAATIAAQEWREPINDAHRRVAAHIVLALERNGALARAEPAPSSGADWQCEECGCRSRAYMDERQPDGHYKPGKSFRCVGCKRETIVLSGAVAEAPILHPRLFAEHVYTLVESDCGTAAITQLVLKRDEALAAANIRIGPALSSPQEGAPAAGADIAKAMNLLAVIWRDGAGDKRDKLQAGPLEPGDARWLQKLIKDQAALIEDLQRQVAKMEGPWKKAHDTWEQECHLQRKRAVQAESALEKAREAIGRTVAAHKAGTPMSQHHLDALVDSISTPPSPAAKGADDGLVNRLRSAALHRAASFGQTYGEKLKPEAWDEWKAADRIEDLQRQVRLDGSRLYDMGCERDRAIEKAKAAEATARSLGEELEDWKLKWSGADQECRAGAERRAALIDENRSLGDALERLIAALGVYPDRTSGARYLSVPDMGRFWIAWDEATSALTPPPQESATPPSPAANISLTTPAKEGAPAAGADIAKAMNLLAVIWRDGAGDKRDKLQAGPLEPDDARWLQKLIKDQAALIEDLQRQVADVASMREALENAREERDTWNKDARRLSGGLLAINKAAESVPASVLRSVAYDVALNCIPPDVAEYQIERRAAALTPPTREPATPAHPRRQGGG